jgi:dihydroorotate dehydrogenase electron transfer subunit
MRGWQISGGVLMVDGLHRTFRVQEVIPEGEIGVTLVLGGALPAEPGQFVMVWLPGLEERPFSIMDNDPLSLTVAEIGPFTAALCALTPGDRLWIRGPYGRGFPLVGQRHLLVGGGSGTAGLTLLAREALAQDHVVTVALGARSDVGLMLRWYFEQLGAQLLIATEDGTAGTAGTVLDAVERRLDARHFDAVYGCGPEPMLVALAERCKAAKLPCWVSLEAVMKCGLGVCGNCHCGDRLVCADGPVFDAADLLAIRQEDVEAIS